MKANVKGLKGNFKNLIVMEIANQFNESGHVVFYTNQFIKSHNSDITVKEQYLLIDEILEELKLLGVRFSRIGSIIEFSYKDHCDSLVNLPAPDSNYYMV